MTEMIQAAVAPVNLWLTVLLSLCCLYWLLVIVGGLSTDSLDVDLDAQADLDLDMDLPDASLEAGDGFGSVLDGDVDLASPGQGTGAGGGSGGSGASGAGGTPVTSVSLGSAALRFFNLGEVPLMIVVTVLTLSMWAISVIAYTWIGDWALGLQFLMLVPIFLVATLIMKIVTWPVKVLFQKLREEERRHQALRLVGKLCRVTSSRVTDRHGQAEYVTEGAPVLLNVRSDNGTQLRRGDEAVIVREDAERGVYFIRAF